MSPYVAAGAFFFSRKMAPNFMEALDEPLRCRRRFFFSSEKWPPKKLSAPDIGSRHIHDRSTIVSPYIHERCIIIRFTIGSQYYRFTIGSR